MNKLPPDNTPAVNNRQTADSTAAIPQPVAAATVPVSIIIPVYNTAEYLPKCLDSALQQTLQVLEIIVVDDASTDASRSIISDYAQRDPRFKLLALPVNQGLGAARNAGMRQASGEYLLFLDSDDWLEPQAAAVMYTAACSASYPMWMCGYIWRSVWHREDRDLSRTQRLSIPQLDSGDANFYAYLLQHRKGLSFMAWQFIYAREFLCQHQLWFPEGIYFEDVVFVAKAAYFAKAVGIVKQPLYNYRYRATSITQTASKPKIMDLHNSLVQVRAFLEQQGVFAQYREAYTLRHLQQAVCGGFIDYLKMPKAARDAELDRHMHDLRFGGYLTAANLQCVQRALLALADDESETKATYAWLYRTAYALQYHYCRFCAVFQLKYYAIALWLRLPGVLRVVQTRLAVWVGQR